MRAGSAAMSVIVACAWCQAAQAGFITVGDAAGMGLSVSNAAGERVWATTAGNAIITRGPSWTSVGAPAFGKPGQVFARWDEAEGESEFESTVVAEWRLEGGLDLFPEGRTIEGRPVLFWHWQFGVGDAVSLTESDFPTMVTRATILLSRDGGETFFSEREFAARLTSPWEGVDLGLRQSSIGSRINAIRIEYHLSRAPTPGTVALAGFALAFGARRRR
ncbi:MAG: hypothetical protein HRU70_03550 [Phycisphaeraceae bacterium]|nr:MAG: hypothetical protein HRU70_03550 [Phycisphaeraceae bacterium]